jgi:hypothetical protein
MTVRARVIGGRLVVDEPTDLPEGTELELTAAGQAEDPAIALAWGEEVDRRAQRALRGEAAGLSRAELGSLQAMPTEDARELLAKRINARK